MPDVIRPAGLSFGDQDDFRLRSSLYHKAGNVIRSGKILAVFQSPDSKMHQMGRFRVVSEAVTRAGCLRFTLSFQANLIFFNSRCPVSALSEKIRRSEFSTEDKELGGPELTPLGECSGVIEL